MQLETALEAYSPETGPGQDALRKAIRQICEEIWDGSAPGATIDPGGKGIFAGTKALDRFMLTLAPKTEAQRQAYIGANAAVSDINKTRPLMGLQISGGIPGRCSPLPSAGRS